MLCDYTISGATIYSLANEGEVYSVMGVRGGKIAHLGRQLPDRPGRVYGMAGHIILPGFIDSHVHLAETGLMSIGLDLRLARSFADVRDCLLAHLDSADYSGGPLIGFGIMAGLLAEGRLPNRFDIDRMLADPAVILVGGEGHSATVNNAAFHALNLPPTLRGIDRDPISDQPTGILRAEAYAQAVSRTMSNFSLTQLARGLAGASNLALARGVTSLHAAEGAGLPGNLDILAVKALGSALEVDTLLYAQSRDVRWVQRMGLTHIGGCFATAIDGAVAVRTAAFLEPYADQPGERGMTYFTQDELDQFVLESHQAGLQISLHAIGDRAIEMAIGAYAGAISRAPRPDHRHRIEHCAFPTEGQLDRIARLGLVVSTQPIFNLLDARMMEVHQRALGEERMRRMMPLRSMLDRRIVVAGSSDMPMVDTNPLAGVQGAVLHPNPAQHTSVYEALRMHTYQGAVAGSSEARKGTLEIGKDADFVVLHQDPFGVPPTRIKDIPIFATYIMGEVWEPGPPSWVNMLWRSSGGRTLIRALSHQLTDRDGE